MKTAALFNEQLLLYDKEPFLPISERDIFKALQSKIIEKEKALPFEAQSELIAFQVVEVSGVNQEKLESYFRPQIAWSNPDGSISEIPDLSKIDKATLEYWEYRCEIVLHPVLQARYSGLVYELSRNITGRPAHYVIAKKYRQALFHTVSKKLSIVPTELVGKIKRAFDLAVLFNDVPLVQEIKTAMLTLENEIAVNEKPGLWGFSFDSLVSGKSKHATLDEEIELVESLEKRLLELSRSDSWATEAAANRLAGYYHARHQKDEVRRVLNILEKVFKKVTEGVAFVQQRHYAEKLYYLYKKFQINDEAQRLLISIREIGKGTDNEMKTISSTINLPKEKVDKWVDNILKGEPEMIFARIIVSHTPKVKEEAEELLRVSKSAPLQFIISQDLVDKKGRKVAAIGPLNDDHEGHLILHISKSLQIGSILLHYTFEEAIKRKIFTTYEVMNFINKSCIIHTNRLPIIQVGVEAYFNQNYIGCIHVIIPQFEEAIRNLIEMNGGNILTQKNGSYILKTFDHILSDSITLEVFGEDISLYFRTIFTDNRGWNLRNNVAHGILEPSHFNKQNADRLLHALLCLGMVRLKNN